MVVKGISELSQETGARSEASFKSRQREWGKTVGIALARTRDKK
jgi:hypothetical protein